MNSDGLRWRKSSNDRIIVSARLPIWPTRVLIRVFLSLLSLCSDTFICSLIISADVNGLRIFACGTTVEPVLGLDVPALGEDGTLEVLVLRDGDFFNIFNPNAVFTLLVIAIPTPGGFGDPGPDKPEAEPGTDPDPDPFPSADPSDDGLRELEIAAVLPPNPGDDRHAVKNIS